MCRSPPFGISRKNASRSPGCRRIESKWRAGRCSAFGLFCSARLISADSISARASNPAIGRKQSLLLEPAFYPMVGPLRSLQSRALNRKGRKGRRKGRKDEGAETGQAWLPAVSCLDFHSRRICTVARSPSRRWKKSGKTRGQGKEKAGGVFANCT